MPVTIERRVGHVHQLSSTFNDTSNKNITMVLSRAAWRAAGIRAATIEAINASFKLASAAQRPATRRLFITVRGILLLIDQRVKAFETQDIR